MADYLPPVVTKLTGDIDDFLAKLAAAQAALDAFANNVKDIPIKFDIDDASIAKVEAIAQAFNAMRPQINVQTNIETNISSITSLIMEETILAATTNRVTNTNYDASRSAYMLAVAYGAQANAAKAAAAANTANNNTLWGWGVLTRDFQLWAGMLGSSGFPATVRGWHIALDTVFESAIALGGALIVLGAGVAAVAPAMTDIYNRMTAVHEVSVAMGVTIPPLTGWFEQLQHAVAPQALEVFGGALNLINGQTGGLTHVIDEVVTGMDDWIAKLDLYMNTQHGVDGVLQSGVGFLKQFSSIVDDLGIALGNLIKADPGTAHFLMDLVGGVGKAIEIISELPTPILLAALAIHSFLLWGGLLTTWIKNVGLAMYGLVSKTLPSLIQGLADLAVNPLTWVVLAAAGVAYLGYQMMQASSGAKALIASLNTQISGDTASQAVTGITTAVGTLNQAINTTKASYGTLQVAFNGNTLAQSFDAGGLISASNHLSAAWQDLKSNNPITVIGGTANNLFDMGMAFVKSTFDGEQASNSVKAYTGEIIKLTGQQKHLFNALGGTMRMGYSFGQSMAIMDLAGVQAGDSFQLMTQKINNLLTGYKAMGIQGGLLGNSINAITFQTEQQASKVSALTQGWSAFITMLTGGESSFVTYEQQLTGMATAASGAAATVTLANGKASVATKGTGTAAKDAASQMNGLTTANLQLRSSFTTAITDASTLDNSLTTMASAAGLGQKGVDLLSRAGKDVVAQLLPMGKGSQYATSMLYGLAQQAGYQGVDSFKALATWVGNTKNPMTDLNGIVNTLTTDSANLAQDVNNLAEALNNNLTQAMASAIAQATGGQAAYDNFATATMTSHHNADSMTKSAVALASELISVTGNTTSAHKEFDTFAQGMGWTQQQADTLWGKVKNLAQALSSIPANVNSNITVTESIIHPIGATSTSTAGGIYPTLSGKAPGLSTGGRVPGYGGGDVVPAYLEPGEAVVPKHLVSGVAPYLGKNNVPGFAMGGLVTGPYGSAGGSEPGVIEVTVFLNGKQIQKTVQQQTYKINRRNGPATTGKMSPR